LAAQGEETQGKDGSGVHAAVLAGRVDAGGLVLLDHYQITAMNAPFSTSILDMAFSEPDVTSIAPHVFAAHEDAKSRLKQHGSTTAEITFRPDVGAFELVAENKDVASILRALGPQAKITIHF
jgi:hypothetical protein